MMITSQKALHIEIAESPSTQQDSTHYPSANRPLTNWSRAVELIAIADGDQSIRQIAGLLDSADNR